MAEERRCGTCAHLIVPLDKAGRRVVRSQDCYPCEVAVNAKAREARGFESALYGLPVPASVRTMIHTSYVTRDAGKNCAWWRSRKTPDPSTGEAFPKTTPHPEGLAVLDDPALTLREWAMLISQLAARHGPDVRMFVDSGHNHSTLVLEKK